MSASAVSCHIAGEGRSATGGLPRRDRGLDRVEDRVSDGVGGPHPVTIPCASVRLTNVRRASLWFCFGLRRRGIRQGRSPALEKPFIGLKKPFSKLQKPFSGRQKGVRSRPKVTTMCRVLNNHKTGVPPGAVYIGRGSKWGNPFRIGADGDRAAVIAKHENWLRDQHHLRARDEPILWWRR